MSTSRRDFFKIAGVIAGAALASSDLGAANEPALGLIFPPKDYPIPPDAKRLYPTGVEFLGDGVGLPGGMTVDRLRRGDPARLPVAQALAKRGAKVISVFGSSMTFYKGARSTRTWSSVTKATGLPTTTQSNGLIDGLRTANAKRVAVATAYTDVVTDRLKLFLEEHGFEVTSAKGLGYRARSRGRRNAGDPVQSRRRRVRGFEEGRCVRRVVRRAADARSDRAAREQDQGARRLIDAARLDERRPAARRQPPRAGIRNGLRARVQLKPALLLDSPGQ